MLRAVRGFVLVVGFLFVGFVPSAHAASAAAPASGLDVRLVVDQPIVTIDRDAPADQPLAFEVIVTNGGTDVVPGVVVEARLPGGVITRDAGDVAAGGEWRAVLDSVVPASTTGSAPLMSVAVARSADGREVESLPARVDVQVISSAVIDRDDPAPTPAPTTAVAPAPSTPATVVQTQVLGATYERPLPAALARTGSPVDALVVAGVALVVGGGLLLRRTADRL